MSDEALLRARGFDGAAHVALSFARHGSHVAHAKVGDASGLNWVRLS
ncbi:MAG: hypothetical protein JNM17_00840 [Archangium sp.]|nr:hypothetical protein [Archangium sp.]